MVQEKAHRTRATYVRDAKEGNVEKPVSKGQNKIRNIT